MSGRSESEIYVQALKLLARREYSAHELRCRLSSIGGDELCIEKVLGRLIAERLQNDQRFAALYLLRRSDNGYGPERICAELQQRGVAEKLIAATLRQAEEDGIDWGEYATAVYRQKYGGRSVADESDLARRQRFLRYRGFTHEQITTAIKSGGGGQTPIL